MNSFAAIFYIFAAWPTPEQLCADSVRDVYFCQAAVLCAEHMGDKTAPAGFDLVFEACDDVTDSPIGTHGTGRKK